MTLATRRFILRANATFLLIASCGGMWADLAGAFLAIGPQKAILGSAPHAAIGSVEAHGLAFIIGVLLWRAEPARPWHLTAAMVHVLLGTSNRCSGGSSSPQTCWRPVMSPRLCIGCSLRFSSPPPIRREPGW